MIKCTFEDGGIASPGLRHLGVGAIAYNDKGQVLLIKRSDKFSRPNTYSVPGGYLTRDETAKEGALRELKEESGMTGEVQQLFHINDYPDRPKEDRQNIDFIYLVKISGGTFVKNDETTGMYWFSRDNLPEEKDFAFDHRKTILKFYDFLEKPFTLPLIGKL